MTHSSHASSRSHRARRGFTLVEMLVVIGIIAVLAALLLPAVMMAMNSVRRGRMALEIKQIEEAIELYHKDTGDYPPSFGDAGAFLRHMRKVYPRVAQSELNYFFQVSNGALVLDAAGNPTWNATRRLDEGEALVFWLGGGPNGIRDDQRYPFFVNVPAGTTPPNYKRRYPFKEDRLEDADGDGYPSYHPDYAKETYYLYVDSRSYKLYAQFTSLGDAGDSSACAEGTSVRENCCRPYWSESPTTNTTATRTRDRFKPMNPTTFQILCAGQDGDFGFHDSSSTTPDTDVKIFPTGVRYNAAGGDQDNMTNFSGGKRLEDSIP
jgi:prepilin-type N-terminal cleavage/methylation domain-containing protein